MQTELTGSHRTAHDLIFRHTLARNLQWKDVRSMLEAMPQVVEEPNHA